MRSRLAAGLIVALALTLAAPRSAAPQARQPLVLQHGFLAAEDTWDKTAPWLERYAYVTTSRFTTGWNSTFDRQAGRLRESMAHLPDTTILIGHSNGGLVTRRLARTRPIKGYITVGTPHRGAPLAESALNGNVAAVGWFIHYFAMDAINAYDRPEFAHPDDWMRDVGLWAAKSEAWLARAIYAFAAAASLLDAFGETVLSEMGPGSEFFSSANGINSHEALHQEEQAVAGPRVAFQTALRETYFPHWLIWKGLRPQQSAELSLVTDAAVLALLITYDHYASYYQPEDYFSREKQSLADHWYFAAAALAGLDFNWCSLIGADGEFHCEPTDGIVPLSHQMHPGRNVSNIRLYGPSHQEQVSSPEFRAATFDALQNTFKVKQPATSEHPLMVSIEGSSGTSVGDHTNTAIATGGTAGYSYRWWISADGGYFEDTGITTPDYTRRMDVGQMFWIMVVVTAGDEQATATRVLGPVCDHDCY